MNQDEWRSLQSKMVEVSSAVYTLQEKHREMKELIHQLYEATPKEHGSTLPKGTGACPVCTGELVHENDTLTCMDCGRCYNVAGDVDQ